MEPDPPVITLGRIVYYCMSEADCSDVKHQRLLNGQTLNGGAVGNEPEPGQVFPALVVAVWSSLGVNLQVFLDGPDKYWALYRSIDVSEGDVFSPGSWRLRLTRSV